MKKLRVLLIAAALLLGGVACSEDTQNEAEQVAEDAADAAREGAEDVGEAAQEGADRAEDIVNDRTVNIDDNAFEPLDREIKVGTEVTWVNQDDVQHTVTAEDGAFESDELDEGDEFSHRFIAEGTYDYYCEIHGKDTMSGSVTVE